MIKRTFEFYKNEKDEWYLNLPEWNGDLEDLQMVEGADKWLDLLSKKASTIKVIMSNEQFENSEILTLLRIKEENLGGGGVYFLETYQNKKVALKLWLCDVTNFVFKTIPQKIYFAI
ncbi:DUF6717 family protein [Pedobacter boryungensis]|uniref:Uncharacterized protein n=1 Tax=Pedobacter boryungensis TaxID=869962 RepID=A0ABX2D849_9SPHI|nr:DUF6717 family protein [Pedobacter boryungensis]NQX30226.1 hypothetical protein [Pedobacter boryungensis]